MKNESEGVKTIRAASDAMVLSAVESRQDTGAFSGSEENGGEEEEGRTEEPSQIHSAVGLRRIDRAVAVRLVWNINVNGGNMRPIRSQFHSRPDTPTPRLSPSDQNRVATPAFEPSLSLPQICIPLSE